MHLRYFYGISSNTSNQIEQSVHGHGYYMRIRSIT